MPSPTPCQALPKRLIEKRPANGSPGAFFGRPTGSSLPPAPHYWGGGVMSGICHSIGGFPAFSSAALICENGLLPKKPLRADSGEGCAD